MSQPIAIEPVLADVSRRWQTLRVTRVCIFKLLLRRHATATDSKQI